MSHHAKLHLTVDDHDPDDLQGRAGGILEGARVARGQAAARGGLDAGAHLIPAAEKAIRRGQAVDTHVGAGVIVCVEPFTERRYSNLP